MTPQEFLYTVFLRPPLLRRMANAFLKSILPATVRVGNAVIHINPSDPVISGALTLRCYERDEIAFFQKYFQPDMIFVDVGANVGLYTGLALATKDFTGKVLCVEPHAESREYLGRTIKENKRGQQVMVAPFAASDHQGALTFYKNSQNKGDNRIYADPLLDQKEEVLCERLEIICRDRGLARVDFLKVDVQGAEVLVLKGLGEFLSASTRCILMTEFWPYGIARCGSDPETYLNLILSLGFELFELDGTQVSPILDGKALIERTQGRKYRNLVGFKGIRP